MGATERARTALITGATSGIGRAMAVTLARAGFAVMAIGRNRAALDSLAREVEGIEPVTLDVSDGAGVAAALAGRRIDILVNNAGIMPRPGPFATSDQDGIARALAVNVQAVLTLTHLVLPQMIARQSGQVIFTGSTAGHAPGANFALYAATKAAIAAFATALRAELAPQGVRVTELVPGRVETALYAPVISPEARAALYDDGHALQPQDVAEALLAAVTLPPRANLARIDILPTRPVRPLSLT